MALDAITLEIIRNRLREIGATMEHSLFHSGYSTILRETHDGSASLCDVEGSAVDAQGAPVHFFPYAMTIRSVLKRYPLETMRNGDAFISSDPYDGGSLHVPDVIIVTPIFVDAEIIGFCCTVAHKPDLGGIVPGSSGAASREIFHEGLLLPGVRYWTGAGVVEEVEAIIRRNCRIPEIISGDLRAQVGSNVIGVRAVRELCREYGTATVKEAFALLLQLAERQVRAKLLLWPDGEAEAETFVDDDGVDLDRQLRLHVRVIKERDRITFDYSGTNDQVKGPTNLRPQASQLAAVLALMNSLDPRIPLNYGVSRPVSFINPEGKITNPRWPAPVNSYYGLTNVLYSTVCNALAKFDPSRAVASPGLGIGAISVGYEHDRNGRRAVQYETFITSQGGTATHDGSSGTSGLQNAALSTPVEVLESEFPARVLRHEWIADSGGAGKFRGGLGNRKEYEMLAPATITLRMGHQLKFPGWGVFGGKPPGGMRLVLNAGAQDERALRPLETFSVKTGDRILIEMPGGGGYGNPFERDPELVSGDVRARRVTRQAAEGEYGVAIDPQRLAVDDDKTARLRRDLRAARDDR